MSSLYGLVILVVEGDTPRVVYTLFNVEGMKEQKAKTLREFVVFGVVEIAARCERDKRVVVSSAELDKVLFTVLVKSSGIGVGLVTSPDFPKATITFLIHRSFQVAADHIPLGGDGFPSRLPELDQLFTHFRSAETPLTKAQAFQIQLDESTEQMNILLNSLMKKGENIEDIAKRSDYLSENAKRYFKTSRKTRRCLGRCPLL